MKTINIEEIWKKRFPHGTLPPYAKEMMIDFGRQLLELAAWNAEIVHDTDYVDKDSIINTINQIK